MKQTFQPLESAFQIGKINFVFYRSGVTTSNPMQWAQQYRCMQLLQKSANETLKYPLAALKMLFLLATIRCLYVIVRTTGYMRLLHGNSTLCYIVFLVVVFRILGQVFDLSEKVLAQQKREVGHRWFRQFHRSCRPLKFEIAGLYYVDPPMSLTMGSFVIQNVVNLLVAEN